MRLKKILDRKLFFRGDKYISSMFHLFQICWWEKNHLFINLWRIAGKWKHAFTHSQYPLNSSWDPWEWSQFYTFHVRRPPNQKLFLLLHKINQLLTEKVFFFFLLYYLLLAHIHIAQRTHWFFPLVRLANTLPIVGRIYELAAWFRALIDF